MPDSDVDGGKDPCDTILQIVTQGKLVPQNPSDEPTSVLLDRMRAEREGLIVAKGAKAAGAFSAAFPMGRAIEAR